MIVWSQQYTEVDEFRRQVQVKRGEFLNAEYDAIGAYVLARKLKEDEEKGAERKAREKANIKSLKATLMQSEPMYEAEAV